MSSVVQPSRLIQYSGYGYDAILGAAEFVAEIVCRPPIKVPKPRKILDSTSDKFYTERYNQISSFRFESPDIDHILYEDDDDDDSIEELLELLD